MLVTPPRSISEAIVSLFAERREQRAEDLHMQISQRYFRCSSRAVYKELRQLVERGVVLKVKDYYSLSITWMLNLIEFSEKLYSISVDAKPIVSQLPQQGQKLKWKFSDLQHMDRFWIQLIFLMFEKSNSRTMFAWVPHFWFDLVHYQKDLEAQQAMRIAGNKLFMMIGGRTFLDKLPTKYWSKQVYEWSYAIGPFERQRNLYFDVIDDLILTVVLDSVTTMRIGELFGRVRSKSDFGMIREFELIKSQAKATMTLERSYSKAKKLRIQCCEFFGIPDPHDAHS